MQIMQALASLADLPSRQADDAELNQRMYFVALEGVTRYALSEAVKAVMRDKLGHTFFPSPVEMRRLCNEAMAPIENMARRIRLTEEQARDRRQFEAINARRTPEAVAHQQAAYRRFCEQHEAGKGRVDPVPFLDPELVANVPDAPNQAQRIRPPLFKRSAA